MEVCGSIFRMFTRSAYDIADLDRLVILDGEVLFLGLTSISFSVLLSGSVCIVRRESHLLLELPRSVVSVMRGLSSVVVIIVVEEPPMFNCCREVGE